MPNHWLLRTEPSTYSYADLEREGRALWDGMTNALALKHLRSMRKGDLAFPYHTGDEKQIVGIAKVVSNLYPNPKQAGGKLVVVDLKPRERLKRPVTLAEIKARKDFADPDESGQAFELVRMGRLSVMPVSAERWNALLAVAEVTRRQGPCKGTAVRRF